MIGRVIWPLASAEVLFLCIVASWLRLPPDEEGPRQATSSAGLIRHMATTVGGGYLVFLVIVLIFHVWIAGQKTALGSAIAGGAFLAFGVAGPVFLLFGWLQGRRASAKKRDQA
jgi:hypothetical protein